MLRRVLLFVSFVFVACSTPGAGASPTAANTTAGPPVERHSLVGDFDPSWTPDGLAVTFTRSLRGELPMLETVPLRRGGPLPLGVRGTQPDWSPTRELLFGALGPTRPAGWPCEPIFSESSPCPQSDIFVRRARHSVNLTRSAADEGDAVWSPNGRRIAFTREVLSPAGASYVALFVMDAKERVRQLTFGAPEPSSPSWTSDGRRIVYDVPDWETGEGEHTDLWSLDPRSGDAARLTHTPRVDELEPAVSPGGRMVAYTDGSSIFVKPLHGGRSKRLTAGIQPAWSPNGRWLAFVRWRGEPAPGQVYVIRSSGGAARQLTFFGS